MAISFKPFCKRDSDEPDHLIPGQADHQFRGKLTTLTATSTANSAFITTNGRPGSTRPCTWITKRLQGPAFFCHQYPIMLGQFVGFDLQKNYGKFVQSTMAIKPLNDEHGLLAKVADGDQRAFTTLFDHYQKYVFGFGLKLTGSEELAEEIVQDIFFKIWYGRNKLGGIESFGAYLNRLVRNHALNLLRQAASHAKANKRIGEALSELDNSTQRNLDYRETSRLLDAAVELLPLQQKKVYTLCQKQGLNYEEAARELDLSPATVHYHMKLALKAIREHLKKNALNYSAFLFLLLREK